LPFGSVIMDGEMIITSTAVAGSLILSQIP